MHSRPLTLSRSLSLLATAAALLASCAGPVGGRSGAVTALAPLRSVEPGGDRRDLEPLGTLVGNARVVALGEPAHGVHEPLALRNRVFEYLVTDLGFTAIALEAPFPEMRRVSEYVAGGPGTAESVLAESRGWGAQPLEENLQLLRWMRAWNTTPGRKRAIRLYAIDLSYTGPFGTHPTPAALEMALAYVRHVDTASARVLDPTFEPWLRRLSNPMLPVSRSEHDVMTAAVDDLVALLERQRVTYVAAGSAAEYEWAHRAAIVAQQADRMFRVAPDAPPEGPIPRDAWRAINARDAAMAENVMWALRQEEPDGRVLVIAHNVHVQGAPNTAGPWSALERLPTSMGEQLRLSLGPRLVSIASSDAASSEALGVTAVQRTRPRPFLVDLRSKWAGFDGVVVMDSLTAAKPVRKGN